MLKSAADLQPFDVLLQDDELHSALALLTDEVDGTWAVSDAPVDGQGRYRCRVLVPVTSGEKFRTLLHLAGGTCMLGMQ